MVAKLTRSTDDLGKLLLRLAVGGLLFFHGLFKLRHGIAWIAGPLSHFGLPGALAYGAYLGEVVAPVLLVAGLWTRLAALAVAVDLGMAILLVLRGRLFAIGQSGGWGVELEAFFILGALAICLLGAGRYSVSRGAGAWD